MAGNQFENFQKGGGQEKKYTLEDFEKERQWDSGLGPNNPGAFHRKFMEHNARLREIEASLRSQGLLELTDDEKISAELDKLYPDAQSRKIVTYQGKKYQIRYFPLNTSRSGKTVFEWGHKWVPAKEKPKK